MCRKVIPIVLYVLLVLFIIKFSAVMVNDFLSIWALAAIFGIPLATAIAIDDIRGH